jgi:glycosyltransferase involved in cell wall biosynthesis
MNDLVSIYVPTKNRRPLLERAVDSVLAQSHAAIELIVVNDCSTDDTAAYLDDLAARDGRVIALHQDKSQGAPAARNRALRIAQGVFATGLDDDDTFTPERIARFVQTWQRLQPREGEVSCLFSESLMTDGVTSTVTTDRKDDVSYTDMFLHNFIGNQVFCPRRYLLEIGGFDEQMPAWQDMELFMRLVQRFGVAKRVAEPTYVCYVDGGRERISGNEKKLRAAYAKLIEKHRDLPEVRRQQLLLQMFSPFYGFKPTRADWQRMLKPGTPATLWWRFLRANLRNHLMR